MTVLTPSEVSSREHLIAVARDLAPSLREGAVQAEELGRLPADVAQSLREAGFFGLHVPAALGGPAVSISTAVAVYEELARSFGAAAWCSLLLSSGGLTASRLTTAGRRMLWSRDFRAGVCAGLGLGGTAERVPGGLRVSGSWQPLSGIHDADWILAPVVVKARSDEPEHVVAVVMPTEGLLIRQTWHMAGMVGTGSDTAVADDVFVPTELIASFADLMGGQKQYPDEPLAGADVYAASAVGAGAVLIGMGRAALEQIRGGLRQTQTSIISTDQDVRDEPRGRLDVALAARLMDTAGLHLDRAVADVERGVTESRPLEPSIQARIGADLATISTCTREALDHLLDAGGARSFASSNPLQRIWRDVAVVSRHPMLTPEDKLHVYARSLFTDMS